MGLGVAGSRTIVTSGIAIESSNSLTAVSKDVVAVSTDVVAVSADVVIVLVEVGVVDAAWETRIAGSGTQVAEGALVAEFDTWVADSDMRTAELDT